ncbi:response regulator [Listeria floridensis FSL S10-1187]|uniref:Response regulator n=1 Tax=Listeria floridensis FSL S10-1187 TaxID=1265817 RepID=A0ABN0RDH6_9LIST|nr:LytTR family DNA-binding domain-containing protein [Listeria floridensis]EUJ29131.1 response regulator [Listeria floridensis FSL S10-1187]
MKIAIVEDNLRHQETLLRYLKAYASEQQLELSIDCYNDGIEIVNQYKSNYDVIYLDVEMDVMNGMEAAERIRKMDDAVLLVFITNYVQWAIAGYSVGATDFLLKPLTYFNFLEHFKKVMKKFSVQSDKALAVKIGSGIRKILLNDLLYIESEGHYLHFHLITETFSILESMKNMEARLKEDGFFRSHNYYLVNLKYVESIDKNWLKIKGEQLQISRPRKKAFLEALTNYIGEDTFV